MAFIKEKGSTLGRDYLRVNRTATCSPFVSYQAPRVSAAPQSPSCTG